MVATYSLHKIHSSAEFGFSPGLYSRFKFGDGIAARHFGEALADGFIEYLKKHPICEQLVVISSPYSFIPTATCAMKDHFVHRLNHYLAESGFSVVQETKVHRTITYKEDYGELNAEERMRLIGNDSFHIDKAFLAGKTLLFLDDIRITGSHERMIRKMAAEYGLSNTMYMLYFAELADLSIHPNIENTLNYYEVKSIFDLDRIINGEDFRINTRLVKYILNYEHGSFRLFIQDQTDAFIRQLYHMAIGNGYHLMENYEPNLTYIKNHLFKNQKLISHGN
jgi:hypothetical protein